MRNPLVRRAFYSFLATAAFLGLVYYLIAIFPAPRLWLANATSDVGMLVQAFFLAVLYGLPAWALSYFLFGLLSIPDVDRPRGGLRTRTSDRGD